MKEYFNRVFEQIKPSPEQKEVILARLLEPERKVAPMKKLKKMTVAGIAAALMVVSCAAAMVTGIDQRLIDYMGWGGQDQELLAPGAAPLDITVEDNGCALRYTQLLMDRSTILVLADFTAPEGTVLDVGYSDRSYLGKWGYARFGDLDMTPRFLDKNGKALPLAACSYGWKVLEDGDPADNHLTMLFSLSLTEGTGLGQEDVCFQLQARDLKAYDREMERDVVLCSGDWSVQIPLPEKDMGWTQRVEDSIVQELYLSPMTLQIRLDQEIGRHMEKLDRKWLTLTDREGRDISMSFIFGAMADKEIRNETYSFDELIDPALLQGGKLTLRLEDKTVDILLDDLAPAE